MAKFSLVDDIKENVRILDVAQRHGIQIQKSDTRSAYAVCPFCGDDSDVSKRNFKCQFYLDSDSFFCHKCRKGGSVFDLVMESEPCDFTTALAILARIAGRDITDKEKDHYHKHLDVWQIPSIYRFILNKLRGETYEYNGLEFTSSEMAHQYLSTRGITNAQLVDDYEIIYVDAKKKFLPLILQETSFTEKAIENSGILAAADFFWRDSILIPIQVNRKIRQMTSISCGMKQDRRNPKALNMNNVLGYSPRRVWGLDKIFDLDPKGIFICEGTIDALSVMQAYYNNQITIPAVALGSQYISELQAQEVTQFPKMNYFIMFDRSDGEDEGIVAQQLADKLSFDTFITHLPLRKPTKKSDPKDLNDLLQLDTNSPHIPREFQGLSFAQMIAKSVKMAIEEKISPPLEIEINEILYAEHMNKRVTCKALPFSDIVSTHSVPIAVRMHCKGIAHCNATDKGKCALGRVGRKGKLIEIELDDPEIIRFCHTKKEEDITRFWVKQIKPPCKAKFIEVITEKTASVHQMELGPNLEYLTGEENQTKFLLVRSYIVNVESESLPDIEPIQCTGRLVPHPFDNHEVTFLITKFEKLKDAIDLFEITDEVKKSLRKFQAMSLTEMLDDVVNYTGIIESPEMHLAFLLTFHSALNYTLDGANYLGCLQTLLLTDTSTGKSTMGERLIKLFRLGERIVCETSGRTGVTYTLTQSGGRWVVRWGAMPRNDRGFLMLDEFQEFPEGESQHIKEARSSGQLKVDRAAKSFAYTRNRLLFAANPKQRYRGASTQLFSFDYPIEAIRTVFTTEADIRRLDLAILIRGTDRTTEELHQRILIGEDKARLTEADWRSSVRWAWKRRKEDIILEEEALTHLLKVRAPALVEKYKFAEDIPLFTASYTKHAIIKMAIALAILVKSTDPTFEKVIVKKQHIDAICDWLDSIYSSTSVRLDSYAAKRKKEIYMTNDDFDEMLAEFAGDKTINQIAGNITTYMGMWKDNESWNTNMLREAADVDQKLLKRFNRVCIGHRLVTKRGTNLNKTPKMAEFIKRFEDRIYANPGWGVSIEDITGGQIDIKDYRRRDVE